MNTETTTSLIDFDSFDPFFPTILTQNDELNQTNPLKTESNVFAKDPFTDTFEDDNWQDAMHNINMKKIENSYGDSFGAFDASDNFGSNWNHEKTSSSNITDSQDLFQFEISRHDEVQRDDHAKDDKNQDNTTKPNGFKETEIVYNDTKMNNTEEGDDIEEDRTRPMKGLAGLKAYDPNIDEEFSYSPPSRNDVTTSSAADKISSKIFNYGSSLENTCKQCNKKVYEMEKITVDFVIYHKSCFRCATCKRMLSPSTYSATDGQIYCKADFLKNFKMKGSYTFTPESSLPKENDEVDDDIRNYNGEETPVVPMKYMKNLFESNDVQADDKPGVWSNDRMDHNDHNDDNTAGVVVSSNVYVLEDELPPPSLARNLRTMFENKSTFKQQSNVTNKNSESSVAVTKSKVESPVINFEPEETNDVPQEGMTKSLLARWRDIEGSGRERTRGREEKRNTGAAQRSQSTTRLEISQRMKVVSNDRPHVSKSKEEGHNVRDFHQSSAPSRTFKWKVKEATPLNRAGIVHGDIPKYQHVTGDIVNEKTPMSEINRDELSYNSPNFEEEYNKSIETKDDSPLKGSYVTEIKEEELPNHAAVKSAMMRFKSMEDPAREPPVPKTRTPSSRFSYHEPIPTTRLDDDDDDDDDDDAAGLKGLEELPAHGTTKKLMVKFQSK